MTVAGMLAEYGSTAAALLDLALGKMAERIHAAPSYQARHALPAVTPLVREPRGLYGSAT